MSVRNGLGGKVVKERGIEKNIPSRGGTKPPETIKKKGGKGQSEGCTGSFNRRTYQGKTSRPPGGARPGNGISSGVSWEKQNPGTQKERGGDVINPPY